MKKKKENKILTKWIQLKVPDKYKEKVHTIRRYDSEGKYPSKYVYVAYLTYAYWTEYRSELFAVSKQILFKEIEKL